MELFGIDIGGSGIKGAPVNLASGELRGERYRLETPQPAKPLAMANTVKEILDHYDWKGSVGCGFPSLIRHGVCATKSNLHEDWVGVHIEELFSKVTGRSVKVVNDADAAGMAEMTYGAGKGVKGLVLTITLGTGIGSGAFFNGELIPNFELGHLLYKDKSIELWAADSARKREDLSYSKWVKRVDFYLNHINRLFSPDLIIIGGGASKKWDKMEPLLTVETKVVPAQTKNEAGIIGAAMASK